MLPEQKEQLEKLKRARVKEDIPKDLAIAIQAFLKQAAIVGEYELDSMPSEYMENLLKLNDDITRTSPELAEMVKLPSKSVLVPVLVPLTRTVAPGKGPSSLETLPLIC